MATLAVRNEAQFILFTTELAGQISDGKWENVPGRHWEAWCRADVIVDPESVGRDFRATKDNYDFTAHDLLEIVGHRMRVKVRLGKVFGVDQVELLEGMFSLEGYWSGIPTWYTDSQREGLAGIDLDEVKRVGNDVALYNSHDMKADLRDLKQIVRTQRRRAVA